MRPRPGIDSGSSEGRKNSTDVSTASTWSSIAFKSLPSQGEKGLKGYMSDLCAQPFFTELDQTRRVVFPSLYCLAARTAELSCVTSRIVGIESSNFADSGIGDTDIEHLLGHCP